MIRIDVKKDKLYTYRLIVEAAQKHGVFKGCGNPNDPWIALKFETADEAVKWLEIVENENLKDT